MKVASQSITMPKAGTIAEAAYDAAYETYQESVIQYRVGESNLQTAREQLEQLKQIYAALQEELTNWDQIDIEQLRARLEELKELLPEGSSAFWTS